MSQHHILVIDDEIRSLETIERTLNEEFHVFTSPHASKAFEILETESISAILCDQRMPEIEGVELLCQIRKRWPDIPRIMISGYTDAESMIDAINEESGDSLVRLQEEFVEFIGVCTSSINPEATNSLKRQRSSVSDSII